jgi:hypothetical protein
MHSSKLTIYKIGLFSLGFVLVGSYIAFRSFAATPSSYGDINNDGVVNITDLSLLLSSYGQNTSQCTTNAAFTCDLSNPGNGKVDVFDLSILLSHYGTNTPTATNPPSQWVVTSVDTMKESMDGAGNGLTQAQIDQHINQIAMLGAKYATVDTPIDKPAVYAMWVQSVRAHGMNVWHRPDDPAKSNPNATPAILENDIKQFILNNPTLFKPGDILDADDEADSDAYWDKYDADPSVWWNGANSTTLTTACQEFDNYMLGLKTVSDQAFATIGVSGVNDGVRSLNPFWSTAKCLSDQTIASLGGWLAMDAYFADDSTDPAFVANAASQAMDNWHAFRPNAKIILSEYGYNNNMQVDDATQTAVLHSIFQVFASKSYVYGLNYWVGAGGPGFGGYTNILTGGTGHWSPRPGATELSHLYGL